MSEPTTDAQKIATYQQIRQRRVERGWDEPEPPPRPRRRRTDHPTGSSSTRPMRSETLDGLAAQLAKLADILRTDGSGRISLAVMETHAEAVGFPSGGMGQLTSGVTECSCPADDPAVQCPHGTSTERAALSAPQDVSAYSDQVRDLTRLLRAATAVLTRHERFAPRALSVCPNCSIEIPNGRVRCPRCNMHPESRVCRNDACSAVLNDEDPGRHGRCEACRRFLERNGRERTADDMRKPRRERVDPKTAQPGG